MTEPPADPLDLEENRRNYRQRFDTAITVLGVNTPEFQERLPGSYTKIMEIGNWISSVNFDPEVAEREIGALSAGGSLKMLLVSVDQAERAMGKGRKYGPRNKLLKAIALKFEQKKPGYPGNRNDAIRDLITEALECLDRGSGASKLDNWFGDKELYNEEALKRFRNKKTGELISAKTIGNLLSALK